MTIRPGVIALALSFVCCSISVGDERRLNDLIKRLGADSFSVRAAASDELKITDSITLKQIERALLTHKLSAEQRSRLMTAAQERFANSDRAAMGVRFGGNLQETRVVIGATFDRFPSFSQVEPGDIIVEAEGVKLYGNPSWATLRSIIISHDPGDKLPVVLRRGERLIQTEITLGRFEDLDTASLSDLDLARAWAIRSARYARETQIDDVLDPGLSSVKWKEMAESETMRRKKVNRKLPAGPTLVAGGQQREKKGRVVSRSRVVQRAAVKGQRRQINTRTFPQDSLNVFDVEKPEVTLEEELDKLDLRESQLTDQIRKLEETLVEMTDSASRDGRERTLDARRTDLRILDKERRAVRAEIAERDAVDGEAADPN